MKNRIAEKLKQVRLPKRGNGNADHPGFDLKGFSLQNISIHSISQRAAFAIASGVLVVVILLATGLFLKSQAAYVPEDNVDMMNEERSQVYVTGTGYAFDRQLKEEQEEGAAGDATDADDGEVDDSDDGSLDDSDSYDSYDSSTSYTPYTPSYNYSRPSSSSYTRPSYINRSSSYYDSSSNKSKDKDKTKDDSDSEDNTGDKTEDENGDQDDSGDDTEDKNTKKSPPEIDFDFLDGTTVEKATFEFSIQVTDYTGEVIPDKSQNAGNFTVTCKGKTKGKTLESIGEEDNRIWFQAELEDGENTIVVKAEDMDGRKSTMKRTVKKAAVVKVVVKAKDIKRDEIYSAEVKFEKDDSAIDVLKAALKEGGYTPKFEGDDVTRLKKKGIAEGAEVTPEIKKKMEKAGVTVKEHKNDDQLKNGDFYATSRWIISLNGKALEKDEKLKAGDKIVLTFDLGEPEPKTGDQTDTDTGADTGNDTDTGTDTGEGADTDAGNGTDNASGAETSADNSANNSADTSADPGAGDAQ